MSLVLMISFELITFFSEILIGKNWRTYQKKLSYVRTCTSYIKQTSNGCKQKCLNTHSTEQKFVKRTFLEYRKFLNNKTSPVQSW